MIYNYPPVTNGIDLDSTLIAEAAQHPNVVGVKLTCGNIGKLTRLTLAFSPEQFAVFGGQAEYLIAGMSVGSSGCITGCGNVLPKTAVQCYRSYQQGDITLAKKAQKHLAEGDRLFDLLGAVTGVKEALQTFYGYGGVGRRPFEALTSPQKTTLSKGLQEIIGKLK